MRDSLKGLYVSADMLKDLEYQEVEAKRWEATVADIRDGENWEWCFVKKDYKGIPLKHFIDNFSRYD